MWPYVKHYIKAATDKTQIGDFRILERELHTGDAILMLAWDGEEAQAAAAVQIREAEDRKVVEIVALGGRNRKAWVHLKDEIAEWGRRYGCNLMRATGRPGWARDLEDFKVKAYVFEKRL